MASATMLTTDQLQRDRISFNYCCLF